MNHYDPLDDDFAAGPPEDSGEGAPEFVLPIPDDDLDFDEGGAPTFRHGNDVDFAPPPGPDPEPLNAAGAGRSKDRRRRTAVTYLGVYVSASTVYGSLVQDSGHGIQVLRRFARQRNSAATGNVPDLVGVTADTVNDGDSGDVQIQFGGSNDLSGSDLFLDSEFGDLANLGELDENLATTKQQATPVVFELKDLLDECSTAGYDKPPVGFCISQPAVEYVELFVPDEKSKKEEKAGSTAAKRKNRAETAEPAVKRDRLLARLAEEYDGPYEKERVAFMPMTAREGTPRFLAIVPTAEDALAESIELLREQSGMRSVPLRSIDAEVPILVGITRWAFPPDGHENTAIVRVGTENTLVILLQGAELHHQEHMLSVTTLDGPDTICSRVLLQQDVQGIGTVHQVIVLSEEREDELVRGFSAFYPDARVVSMRKGLREHGVMPPPGDAALSARALPALGAALRLLVERDKSTAFDDVNMLPKRLRRMRPKLDLFIAWHTLVAAVVLFFAVLFFVGVYFGQQSQIQEAETRLAAYPAEVNMSPQALQAQIDSLQNVFNRITTTLGTIDSLLVGSDRWSRSIARLARSTSSTGGAWVEQWTPQGGAVQLSGYATARDQVVQFAERMNGSIDELRFAQIRDYPVYSFVLSAPIPNEMPEVALYLREQASAPLPPEPDPLGGALAAEEEAAAATN